jgi:hypothetical protein
VRVSTRKTNCHYLLQHHESFSLPLIITIIAHPMDLLLSYNEQLKEEKMENKVQYSSHLRYKLWRFGAVDAINNRVSCLPTQHSHMAHRTFQWSYWLFLLPRSNKFVRDWDSKAAVQRCRQQKKKDQEAPSQLLIAKDKSQHSTQGYITHTINTKTLIKAAQTGHQTRAPQKPQHLLPSLPDTPRLQHPCPQRFAGWPATR